MVIYRNRINRLVFIRETNSVLAKIKNVRFKYYVDGLWVLPRMSGFDPGLVHVCFVEGAMAQGYFHTVVGFC